MKKHFLVGCLLALLATGCHSSSTSDNTTTVPAAHPDATNPAAPMDHMAGMSGPAPTGNSPRAQAMRLHDAAMNSMDALNSERQRLTSRLAQISPSTPTTPATAARLRRTVAELQQADKQMMDWMHNLQEPDSTSQPRDQVDAFWRQQLPGLQQLDQRIKAALDSAKAIR
jgi:hypothetical protein